jgi:hypothetical protein
LATAVPNHGDSSHADSHRGQHGEEADQVLADRRARRIAQARRRLREPRQRQRGEHRQARHQRRHQAVDLGPGHADAGDAVRPDQRHAAGEDHREAVPHHEQRRADAALARRQQVDAVGIDDDVLRRADEGHQHAQSREEGQRQRGRDVGQREQRHGQQGLREHDPAAATPEQRQVDAIHQRRPQELEGVGDADQREEADGRHVQAVHREPGLHRQARQGQRQAGGEAHHEDRDGAVGGGHGAGADHVRFAHRAIVAGRLAGSMSRKRQ